MGKFSKGPPIDVSMAQSVNSASHGSQQKTDESTEQNGCFEKKGPNAGRSGASDRRIYSVTANQFETVLALSG